MIKDGRGARGDAMDTTTTEFLEIKFSLSLMY